MSHSWISIRTREAISEKRRNWTLSPRHKEDTENFYFPVHDPFNIRKAVVPLFETQSDGMLVGLGTAFGVSANGLLLTADHVIAEYRQFSELLNADRLSPLFEVPNDRPLVAFLSPGVVFGTMSISPDFFPLVTAMCSPTKEGDCPMQDLQGQPNYQAADVSVLRTQELKKELHTLRIRTSKVRPNIGDRVVAVGFPKLGIVKGSTQEVAAILEEGMYASYGTVTAHHPKGRDNTNQTPVFEVEAHWPSGMSGGPVFNENGDVIGLVSRSLERSNDHPGVGWATWLAHLPELKPLLLQG